MTTTERMPLPNTAFYRAMRSGHLNRTGHDLVAYLVRVDGGMVDIVRECCGDSEEDES
jgi:hypothetical protein